jgi:hypothetical protein
MYETALRSQKYSNHYFFELACTDIRGKLAEIEKTITVKNLT